MEGNWKKKVEEIGKKLEDYWRKLVYCALTKESVTTNTPYSAQEAEYRGDYAGGGEIAIVDNDGTIIEVVQEAQEEPDDY